LTRDLRRPAVPVDLITLGEAGSLSLALGFLVLFMTGWIVPKPSHEDVKRQRDVLQATNDKLAEALRASLVQRRD
jgi:hypothetical protein